MSVRKTQGGAEGVLPVVEAARILLKLRDVPGMKHVTNPLVVQLKGTDWTWIADDELFDVCLRLLALHTYGVDIMNGTVMALLANTLIAHEKQSGGPYCDSNGTVDNATNAVIGHLFVALGAPLPALDHYLNDVSIKHDWKVRLPIEAQDNEVTTRAHDNLLQLKEPLRKEALLLWEAVRAADRHQEITMLPFVFAKSLTERPAVITDDMCFELGLANFYMWMAYTVYDDIIDDMANIARLPVANVALRKSMLIYDRLEEAFGISRATASEAFDRMDVANAWELTHCRLKVEQGRIFIGALPQYGNGAVLAERAIGHLLGPCMISQFLGKTSAAQKRALRDGYTHYLIARQLNDDMHDWAEDLQAGHISFVVAFLLRRLKIKAGSYDLLELTAQMQEDFWHSRLKELCDLVLSHTARARLCFEKYSLLQEDAPFITLLDHMEQVVTSSMAAQKNRHDFLRIYAP